MRITALVKSRQHVCCRYRIAAFRPGLEALGHRVDIRRWSNLWFLQQLMPPLQNGELLLVQRRLFPAWQLRMMRGSARWLLYDFDDSIFLNSSYNPRGHDCPKRFGQFKHMVQAADIVVAGNEFLRDQATALTDPAKVRVIPTVVDPSRYPLAAHDEARKPVKLAWIGSSSTLRGLERIRVLLDELGRTVPRLELKLICDRSITLEHLPVVFRRWSESTEAAELADADIGMSWLPDDDWSAGKCGLKVLQYMAAGLPVVANPVGVQKSLVRHGETGFLVETPEEWHDAIEWLARDAALRRQMGAAGRRRVETEFNVAHAAAAWQRLAAELARRDFTVSV